MSKSRLLFLLLIFVNCVRAQTEINSGQLTACLTHPKFVSWFNICRNEKDTISIYINVARTDKLTSLKTSCDKTLVIENSSIVIDVNKGIPNCKSQIVLYKFEIKHKKFLLFFKREKYELSFLNICSNANMVL